MFTKTLKVFFVTLVALIIIPAALIAQQRPQPGQMQMQQELPEISDKELSCFANAFDKVNVLNNEMNTKMVEVVEESGMTVESFNKVFEEIQTAESNKDISVEKKEIDKYNKAMQEVQKVQTDQQKEISSTIEDEGLTRKKYDQIYAVLQQDEETLKRFKKMISE